MQYFPRSRFVELQLFVFKRGPVAQLGARFHGMEEVAGSIPARSTNLNQLNQRKLGNLYLVNPAADARSALSLVRLPVATRHTPGKTALSTR